MEAKPHCCHDSSEEHSADKKKLDKFLLGTSLIILFSYLSSFFFGHLSLLPAWFQGFSSSVYELINIMFWGIVAGIIFIGLLGRVPREFVIAVLGKEQGVTGILRAAVGGVLLDLCSHGILMVGAKLYERGASLGQVMAFLIASPWNSFSFTLILWAMVGFKWMFTFLILSMVIAVISGLIFDRLENKNVLPGNPNRMDLPEGFHLLNESRQAFSKAEVNISLLKDILWNGLLDSRMVMRWIFFGVILAALIRTFMSPEHFQTFFGPTLMGLGLTLVVATVLEVCSEGTLPVAADLLTRANAPGNSLTFLMAGVSTDYTEIMVLKETTNSWKIPLFLPLVTLPQILLLAVLLNFIAV